MRFIYLTTKRYPSTTADHHFIREMAKAFNVLLPNQFELIVAGEKGDELIGISHKNLGLSHPRGRTLYYMFWLPYFILKEKLKKKDTVFFSNDLNLLTILILLKKILRFQYRIVSDWHMLFGSRRDSFVAKQSDRLITTTSHLKEIIVEHLHINESKVTVAYGGVDLNIFNEHQDKIDLRKRFGLPVTAFLVGYVGFYKTLGLSKGLDTMIDALSRISDKDVHMAFVGGKPEEIEEYGSLAREKGVSDRCHFIPVVSPSRIPEYEKSMDVLTIPYPDKPHFRDYGFPMKTYEYMASERPILYSALPLIGEVLDDCATSFIPGDAGDLARKIEYLYSDKAKQDIASRVAQASAKVKECTWQKRAEQILETL